MGIESYQTTGFSYASSYWLWGGYSAGINKVLTKYMGGYHTGYWIFLKNPICPGYQ